MGKKDRKLTPQEEKVSAFARHSISSRSTFHPRQWRSGKEPADIVVVIGRAALIFNMHEGRSYFDDLVRHNIQQAKDRLLDWEGGRQIRGDNKWRSFAIDWSDIDQIAIISVVDGRHAACLNHGILGLGMRAKVRLCTTITSNVVYELAIRGGSARDLLVICKSMIGVGKLTEREVINIIWHRYEYLYQTAKANAPIEPTRLGRAIINGKEVSWFDEFRHLFEGMRRQNAAHCEVFSDLSWAEIFPAISFTTAVSADIESRENGTIAAAEFGTSNTFYIIVSTNSEGLAKFIGHFMDNAANKSCQFIASFSLTGIGVLPMLAIIPNSLPWSIEIDLQSLAQ